MPAIGCTGSFLQLPLPALPVFFISFSIRYYLSSIRLVFLLLFPSVLVDVIGAETPVFRLSSFPQNWLWAAQSITLISSPRHAASDRLITQEIPHAGTTSPAACRGSCTLQPLSFPSSRQGKCIVVDLTCI